MNPYDDAAYAKGYDESLELRRERDSYRDALYAARRELDVVHNEVGNLLERLRIKGDQLDAAEDDIDRLNQMLRATGYGQGQIDAYADECEARERAQRERDEARGSNEKLRGLLREACIGYEHNFDDASSDKRLRRVPIFHAWYERAQAALEGKQ